MSWIMIIHFAFQQDFFCSSRSMTIECTVGIRCILPPEFFPLTSIVKKSCNYECCVNNMLQIIQNKMNSEGLELEQSMFRRTTVSGQYPLIWVQNFQKYSTPSSHWNIIGGVEYLIQKILEPSVNQGMLIWYSSPSKYT